MYTLCSLSSTCCNFSLIVCFFNWFWYQKFCSFLKVIAFPFYLIRAYMNQWITQQKVQMFMIIYEIIGFGYVFLMNSMFFLGLRMQFRSRRLCHCTRDSASWIVTDADLFPLKNSWLYLNSLLIPFHRLYIRSIHRMCGYVWNSWCQWSCGAQRTKTTFNSNISFEIPFPTTSRHDLSPTVNFSTFQFTC